VERRLRLLTQHIDELRKAFRETRRHHPLTIEAMVVLPDHLHAVWTLPVGEADFATRWRPIKSAFSRKLSNRRTNFRESRRQGRTRHLAAVPSVPSAMRTILRVI
jgi:putative transposase